jgi:hypothetical protein
MIEGMPEVVAPSSHRNPYPPQPTPPYSDSEGTSSKVSCFVMSAWVDCLLEEVQSWTKAELTSL